MFKFIIILSKLLNSLGETDFYLIYIGIHKSDNYLCNFLFQSLLREAGPLRQKHQKLAE